MRIYAAADIHGKDERIERIRSKLSVLNADILILAGDITNYTSPAKILTRINALPVPVFLVRGNSDFKRVDSLCRFYSNCASLEGAVMKIRSIPFVGMGGTIPIPFFSRIALNESSNLRKIAPLVNTDTVLVTHTPPRGVQDLVMGRFHAGSAGLLRLVKNRQPQILICGHIHEDSGITKIGNTHIVNCAFIRKRSGALIVFENRRLVDLKMI
jgi:uncharacterized protein